MDGTYIFFLAVTFCLTSISYLTFNKRQRDVLVKRFQWRSRRASSSKTPPRSLSPETKVPNNGPPTVDYVNSFPPSRREALATIAQTLPPSQQQKLIGHDIDAGLSAKSMMPFNADFRECDGGLYTPTGFSADEVRALGDFPDYSILSGVPAPKPYHDFDINKALPRPYRPFRWAYHQTMCEWIAYPSCQLKANLIVKLLPNWNLIGGWRLIRHTKSALQREKHSTKSMESWFCNIFLAQNWHAKS